VKDLEKVGGGCQYLKNVYSQRMTYRSCMGHGSEVSIIRVFFSNEVLSTQACSYQSLFLTDLISNRIYYRKFTTIKEKSIALIYSCFMTSLSSLIDMLIIILALESRLQVYLASLMPQPRNFCSLNSLIVQKNTSCLISKL
jgi:hypothetical protein